MSNTVKSIPLPVSDVDVQPFSTQDEWLPAQGFVGIQGMPGTAKGCRLRLEKLAGLKPAIKRKRTGHKGYEYHVSAATMSLKTESEHGKDVFTFLSEDDEQLNLWVPLLKTMSPQSRKVLLQQALALLAQDLSNTPDSQA
ncbi:hypothetical protein [Budvicia aquatica]|uniref:HTH Mu-type domain-containing protein n=1 Tax=Budvicia aquatica TaxID=82979 RepID=A0A484ZVV4_9GAMM|nr:hypothetical protein [Budvicia aquatica]VFS53067.1 Uncharacterised protein [Budvicia aquatica]